MAKVKLAYIKARVKSKEFTAVDELQSLMDLYSLAMVIKGSKS